MLAAAALAFRDIFSPPFRTVLWKSVGLTFGLLAALWIMLTWFAASAVDLPLGWLDAGFSILTGIGLVIGLGFLVAPIAALFVGLFLDDIAEVVERTHYPGDPPGQVMPIGRSLVMTMKFVGVVLLVNLVALPLVLVLGFGFLIFLVANAYLLGREYFELAALRHRDPTAAQALRQRNAGQIFGAGLLIAAFLAIPILNLLAPLFGTAFMVHFHKLIAARERSRA
jgi:CysZ protein